MIQCIISLHADTFRVHLLSVLLPQQWTKINGQFGSTGGGPASFILVLQRGAACHTDAYLYFIYLCLCLCLSARHMDGQLCPSFLKLPFFKNEVFLKLQRNEPHFETFASPELFLMIDKLMSGFPILLVGQLPSKLFMFLLLWLTASPS